MILPFAHPNKQLCMVRCGDDKTIKVWDAAAGRRQYIFEGHEAPVYSVCPHYKENIQVSAAILFDAGIVSCLDHLEAIPWSVDEEKKVLSHLRELQLPDYVAAEVLKRASNETPPPSRVDDIITGLLNGVLQSKDNKARQEMKSLILRLLPGDISDHSNRLDVSRESLYHICRTCLSSPVLCVSEATGVDEGRQDRGALMGEIAREADNLLWIGTILIKKKIADEFVKLWPDQKELAVLHSKIHTMYSHQISRITSDLFIGIGRGIILVPKETRVSLISTWLEPLYKDYAWMSRSWKSTHKSLVEDGLSQTILTLPLQQQQAIMCKWFYVFLSKGNDCPNIKKGFEVWWRRAFIKQQSIADHENAGLQITVLDSLS